MSLFLLHDGKIYFDNLGIKAAYNSCQTPRKNGSYSYVNGIQLSYMVKACFLSTLNIFISVIGDIPDWMPTDKSNLSSDTTTHKLIYDAIFRLEKSASDNAGVINLEGMNAADKAVVENLCSIVNDFTLFIVTQRLIIVIDKSKRRTGDNVFQIDSKSTYAAGSRADVTEILLELGYSVDDAIYYSGVFDSYTLSMEGGRNEYIKISNILPLNLKLPMPVGGVHPRAPRKRPAKKKPVV